MTDKTSGPVEKSGIAFILIIVSLLWYPDEIFELLVEETDEIGNFRIKPFFYFNFSQKKYFT